MSTLFEAPVHLVMMLAAIVAGQDPAAPPVAGAMRGAEAGQGNYAFSDTTWLTAVRQGFGGAKVEAYRGRIFTTSGGRVYVPVAAEKIEILAARQNADTARAVAVDLARFNAAGLRSRLGRGPGVKDLYAAHMFGLDNAARLAGLKATEPNAFVATALPELASAYPDAVMRRGSPVTVASFYQSLPGAGPEAAIAANITPAQMPEILTAGPAAGLVIGVPDQASVDRAAPLRGVIKDIDQASNATAGARGLEQVAGLEWTTTVLRTP